MYINFQPNLLSTSIKTVHTKLQKYLQKIASSKYLQLSVVILKKSINSDVHHRKTYICLFITAKSS